MKQILIDADAIVAYSISDDSGHHWSLEHSQILDQEKYQIFLTSYAYGEALTVVSQKKSVDFAISVAKHLECVGYSIVEVDKALRLKGLAWFQKQTSKNARFTDCVNMALMAELGISLIFSRDKHYSANGFKRLGFEL